MRRAELQTLIDSPYGHFSRTTVELEVNWATDGLFLNFQGGSFTFCLKTSHSKSEFAVSSNSSRSWQRSRAFLKFTSVQGEPVAGTGIKRGTPWSQDGVLLLQFNCMRAERKYLPSSVYHLLFLSHLLVHIFFCYWSGTSITLSVDVLTLNEEQISLDLSEQHIVVTMLLTYLHKANTIFHFL